MSMILLLSRIFPLSVVGASSGINLNDETHPTLGIDQ